MKFPWLVLLVLVMGGMAIAQPIAVPAINPDPRIIWTQYDVSGMMLVNPSVRDSTGVLVLPGGAVLSVPKVVPPDSL